MAVKQAMKLARSYRLRLERRRRGLRAFRKSLELTSKANRTHLIKDDTVILICVVRNERVRLPYFFRYYRRLGITHFIIIDNGSVDGTWCGTLVSDGGYRRVFRLSKL